MADTFAAEFEDIIKAFSDMLELFEIQKITAQDDRRAVEENQSAKPFKTYPDKKSCVIMVLGAFGIAWDALMTRIENQPGTPERESVSDKLGLVLGFLMQPNTLQAREKGADLSDENARKQSARKLRNAIGHGRWNFNMTTSCFRFCTDYDKKFHSFEIRLFNLWHFFAMFVELSNEGNRNEGNRFSGELMRSLINANVESYSNIAIRDLLKPI